MPVIDSKNVETKRHSTYPSPYDALCFGKTSLRLSDAGGLTQFGAHVFTLPPGAWSSQRHHHSHEDEMVYIVSGHPSFIDDEGERILNPGDSTCHPAGDGNAHHMINRTETDVIYLAIGSRRQEIDHCRYPDIDLDLPPNGTANRIFTSKP